MDRTLGRPTEHVEMDISAGSSPAPLPDLSPEELTVLQRVVRRSSGDVVEGVVADKD